METLDSTKLESRVQCVVRTQCQSYVKGQAEVKVDFLSADAVWGGNADRQLSLRTPRGGGTTGGREEVGVGRRGVDLRQGRWGGEAGGGSLHTEGGGGEEGGSWGGSDGAVSRGGVGGRAGGGGRR